MNSEIPHLPETEMDEFESTQKVGVKAVAHNTIKVAKIGVIAIVVLFVAGVGIYALSIISQSRNNQVSNTPQPSQVAEASPTALPNVQYPTEYQVVEEKVNRYDREINGANEARTRLNPPSMNITATF